MTDPFTNDQPTSVARSATDENGMTASEAAERIRLFVAIGVPEDVRAAIGTAQGRLRRLVPADAIRWTGIDQLHLTLKFLGSVETAHLEPLSVALRAVAQDHVAFRLRAESIGAFPNLRRPRVLWVGIADRQNLLERLQAAVESASQPFTRESAGQKFSGHVTLGRVKSLAPNERDALAAATAGLSNRQFGEWTAREIELIRSELSSEGAHHTVVEAFALAHGQE